MKTAIKKSLVLVALFLATSISYGNVISGNTNNGKNKLTNARFENVKKGSILSIKDMNGSVLYREIIRERGNYGKGFDLTSLTDGEYYLELNRDIEVSVIPFKVVATIVTFKKEASINILKPLVFVNNKNVYISKISFEDEVLRVNIFSNNSKLVYSDSVKLDGNILGKIYEFPTSLKGNYTIVMTTKERSFIQRIKI